MSGEDSVKSIIYGSCIANSYGKFRALCAALSSMGKSFIIQNIFQRQWIIWGQSITSRSLINTYMHTD